MPKLRVRFDWQYLVSRTGLQSRQWPVKVPFAHRRGYAGEKEKFTTHPEESELKGPNMEQAPHVSEEAAALSQIKGETGPDLSQGTPVTEIVKGDKAAQEKLPQVMKDALKQQSAQPKPPTGSRSFSTYARRPLEQQEFSDSQEDFARFMRQESVEKEIFATGGTDSEVPTHPQGFAMATGAVTQKLGHKFPLPTIPLPPQSHLKRRYDPVVEQITKLMMVDGKLSVAQRNMSTILTYLRTSPAPNPSPNYPLLPNSPPANHLPLHPTLYLTLAIDSVAPLMRINSQRGAAGGGAALQIPMPLGLRQRRRQAFLWILASAEKKKGGTSEFAKRIAEEIVAVVEGRSAAWQRREGVHRTGVTARANLTFMMGRRRR